MQEKNIIYIKVNQDTHLKMMQFQDMLTCSDLSDKAMLIIFFNSFEPYQYTNQTLLKLFQLCTKTSTEACAKMSESVHPREFIEYLKAEFKILEEEMLIFIRLMEFTEEAQINHFAPLSALCFLPANATNLHEHLYFMGFKTKNADEIRNRVQNLVKMTITRKENIIYSSYHIEGHPEIVKEVFNKLSADSELLESKEMRIIDIMIYTKSNDQFKKLKESNIRHLSLQKLVVNTHQILIDDTFEGTLGQLSLESLMPSSYLLLVANLLRKKVIFKSITGSEYGYQIVECAGKFRLEIIGNVKFGFIKDHIEFLMTVFKEQIN